MVGLSVRLMAALVLLRGGASFGFSPACTSCCHHPPTSLPSRPSQLQMADDASLNMDDLRKRMERQESQYARLVVEQAKYVEEGQGIPETVHIVLFHPGTERQHVHTIEFPKGSGTNIILAFEGEGDCVEFARLLQDLEFADPCPEETLFEPFRQFCEMSGMSLMIVPKGFELTPPQLNANDDIDEDETTIRNDLAEDDGDDELADAWG
ncbi:hypothetical protein ACHAXT_012908 [Thalassiosira profunda]